MQNIPKFTLRNIILWIIGFIISVSLIGFIGGWFNNELQTSPNKNTTISTVPK